MFLNARDTYHRVTEVKGNRLSVIYHTPQHLHRLDKEDWESLRESGFPVDADWELGLSPPEEDEPDEEVEEVFQTICQSITMTPPVTPGLEDVKDQEISTSTFQDSAVMRPTLQAILWISEIIARSGVIQGNGPHDGPRVGTQRIVEEMARVNGLVESIASTEEISLVVLHLAEILVTIIRLTIDLGMQEHLGLMLLHALETEEEKGEPDAQDPSYMGILRTISLIPSKLIWDWVPKIHSLTKVCPVQERN